MHNRRLLKVIMASFLCLVILLVVSVELTSRPRFCISCHEMQSAAESWQKSTHSQYLCVSCHKLNPIANSAMLVSHLTQTPLTLSVKSVSCTECHNLNRIVTPPGDLIIPHRLHISKNIACNSCHAGVGHLNALDQENVQTADISMGLCFNCHYKNGGPMGCRRCHRKPPVTLAHLQPDWTLTHGREVAKDLEACNNCHKFTLLLNPAKRHTLQQVLASPALYAKDNEYCAACHRLRPASHGEYFLIEHATFAVDREDDCLVCHEWDYPLPTMQAPDLYCQQCHAYRGWVPLPYGKGRQLIPPPSHS